MINTKIYYTREYDNVAIEGVLVDRFTHTNEGYGETKDIALIFYEDYIGHFRPLFRYVEINNDRLQICDGEKSKYEANSKYELMTKYVSEFVKEYYIEDFIYNFVNYSGIKI